jgi:ADP-ribose pyrophosphatase YjhB (NUDIX family)
VLRAEVDGDPWSGHVALPGGRGEEADADLLDTARRELREEAAIDLPRDAYAGRLDDLHPRSAHLPSIVVSPFVAWLGERPELSENYELAGHLWIPLAELVAPGRRAQLERPGSPPRVFETIEYAGATVWGMTLAIVPGTRLAASRGEDDDREAAEVGKRPDHVLDAVPVVRRPGERDGGQQSQDRQRQTRDHRLARRLGSRHQADAKPDHDGDPDHQSRGRERCRLEASSRHRQGDGGGRNRASDQVFHI